MTDVHEVDREDAAALRAWWEAGHEANAHKPVDLFWPWSYVRRAFAVPAADRVRVLLAATEGGRTVGAAWMELPTADNTHLAALEVYVVPGARRRGVGTALLEAAEARARAEGRTTWVSEAHPPVDAEDAGSLFAAARGYAVANREQVKAADLAATEGLWPALAAEAAAHLGDYRVVTWTDPTPEEHLAGLCALYSRFMDEVPLGEMDLHPQSWTPERLRRTEERRAAAGRAHVLAAAVAPDGSLAGYSDLVLSAEEPEVAHIDSTLVLPEHRGHRLGLAMKVRLHQLTRELFPGCRHVVTANADVNAPMNAVNARLGYRVVLRCLDLQKVVPGGRD